MEFLRLNGSATETDPLTRHHFHVGGSAKGSKVSQCGNFMIFPSLRFYVKSTLENVKGLKIPIFAILGALNYINLVIFSLYELQNFIKNPHSEPLNVLKWQILHF